MIIYDLRCANAHRFEGWFASAEVFARQLEEKLIRCPSCESSSVRRVPSAVHLSESTSRNVQAADNVQKNVVPAAQRVSVDEALALYRTAVQQLLASSDDVGHQFADEARKIHYGETTARLIHGIAEPEVVEDLIEEGIDVIQLLRVKDRGGAN